MRDDDGPTVSERFQRSPALDVTLEQEPGDEPPVAPLLAGYDLVRVIGHGGMGVVWEAIEHRFDRRVAVKVHGRGWDKTQKDELWAGAFVAARIGDPSIVSRPANGIALSATFAADRAVAVAIHESGLIASVGKAETGPYAGRRVTVLTRAVTGA